jgi:hypothetical protein
MKIGCEPKISPLQNPEILELLQQLIRINENIVEMMRVKP